MDAIYHQLSREESINRLNTTPDGLKMEEVLKRQAEHGRNTIPQPKSKTLLRIFLSQFLNPLIYVLQPRLFRFLPATSETLFL